MTTNASVRQTLLDCDGTTGPFNYSFPIKSASDLKVYRYPPAGDRVLLSYGVQYSISGIGNDTGSITLMTAYADGQILISADTALSQTLAFPEGDTDAFTPEAADEGFDRQMRIMQEIARTLGQAVRIDPKSVIEGTTTGPITAVPKKALIFDAAGNLTTSLNDADESWDAILVSAGLSEPFALQAKGYRDETLVAATEVQTNTDQVAADAAQTAADVISTNADAAQTAADVLAADADAAAAAASAAAAAVSAAAAAASAIITNFRTADVVATAPIALTGLQTIDGVILTAGKTVLVTAQASTPTNGKYVVASGAWARATDMDTWNEIRGSVVTILEGTTYAQTIWAAVAASGGTLGASPITFVSITDASSLVFDDSITEFDAESVQIAIDLSSLLTQPAVLSSSLAAQPVSPVAGDVYILPASGLSGAAWTGHTNEIAIYYGGSWLFVVPNIGRRYYDIANGITVLYLNDAWSRLPNRIYDLSGTGDGPFVEIADGAWILAGEPSTSPFIGYGDGTQAAALNAALNLAKTLHVGVMFSGLWQSLTEQTDPAALSRHFCVYIPSGTSFRGMDMRFTQLGLANGADCGIVAIADPSGVCAQYIGDFQLYGNSANQSSDGGEYAMSIEPSVSSPHYLTVQNLRFRDTFGDGFIVNANVADAMFFNIRAHGGGTTGSGAHYFTLAASDSEYIGIDVGAVNAGGMDLASGSQYFGMKAWLCGQTDATHGHGFTLNGRRITFVGLAQDCAGQAMRMFGSSDTDANRCSDCDITLRIDSCAAGLLYGDYTKSNDVRVHGFTRGTGVYTLTRVVDFTGTHNKFSRMWISSGDDTAPFDSAANIGDVQIFLAKPSSGRTLTYAASVTPNAFTQEHMLITLAGNITIENPLNSYDGAKLKFQIKQDGGGGNVVTWGSDYRVSDWIANPVASSRSGIQFEYNTVDSLWIQSDGGGSTVNVLAVANGTVGAPTMTFGRDLNLGFYRIGADNIGLSIGGVLAWDVSSSAVTTTVAMLGANGSAANPNYSFASDTDIGMYRIGANDLGFASGGVLKWEIAASANTSYSREVIQNGALGLTVGADAGAGTLTDATAKAARINAAHYTNAEEPVGIAYVDAAVATSVLHIGGGTSSVNAPTSIVFETATNNTTTSGTARRTITATEETTTLPQQGADGSASAPAFSYSGDTNTGTYRISADIIGIAAGGAEVARFSSAGVSLNGGTTVINPLRARNTAQFDKTSSAGLANITGLTVNVAAGGTYSFRAVLTVTSTVNGGVKFAISGTATATTFNATAWCYNAATLNLSSKTTTFGNAIGSTLTVNTDVVIEGTIVVNAAGTLTVQFAQNTSHVDTSSVLIGSKWTVDAIA